MATSQVWSFMGRDSHDGVGDLFGGVDQLVVTSHPVGEEPDDAAAFFVTSVAIAGLIDVAVPAEDRTFRSGEESVDLPDIFGLRDDKLFRATAALASFDSILPAQGAAALLDTLDGNSHKHAYGVSTDLKYALREAIELGDIAPTDTEVVAYAWMGAIYGLVIRWVTTGEPEPGRIMDGLVPLLLRSVGYEDPRTVAPTEERPAS